MSVLRKPNKESKTRLQSQMRGRNKKVSRAISLLLCVCLLTVIAFTGTSRETAYADSKATQKKLDAVNEQIDNLKDQQAAIDNKIDSYSSDLSSVSAQAALLNDKVALKEDEIALMEEYIEEAEAQIAQQYSDMKTRIRYMYENSNTPYLTLLLEAGSLADFFNETQYISAIEKYDREQLVSYQENLASLEEQLALLESEKSELNDLENAAKSKQSQLTTMVANAEAELAETEAALEEQLAAAKAYEEQIEREKLEEEMARAAALAAAGGYRWNSANYTAEEADLIMMAAIIYCEAGGEIYAGQLAVGSVVMNRCNSDRFPNTVTGVIYQSGQFAPVASGRFALALENGLYKHCLSAASEVLGGHITNNYLYFHSLRGWTSDYGEVIGNQVFY